MSDQPWGTDYPKFHDPSIRDRDGKLLRHTFADGSPRYTVCMRCGASRQSKMGMTGPFIHL